MGTGLLSTPCAGTELLLLELLLLAELLQLLLRKRLRLKGLILTLDDLPGLSGGSRFASIRLVMGALKTASC